MIEQQYDRLAEETGRPCYSVTLWRTDDGHWGARAGLGGNAFDDSLGRAVEKAVDSAIIAQLERNAQDAARKASATLGKV